MAIPLHLTIREIGNTEAIEDKIREKVEKLERFCDRIMSCHVVVDTEQKHKHQGKLYSVRVDVIVPSKEIVVNRVMNEDLYVAIRDAFNAARRQLEEYTRKQSGRVKYHEPALYGKVVRLFPEEEYGFIAALNDTEYYFSYGNVIHPQVHELTVGDEVEFLEVQAGDGLQAVKVTKISH